MYEVYGPWYKIANKYCQLNENNEIVVRHMPGDEYFGVSKIPTNMNIHFSKIFTSGGTK